MLNNVANHYWVIGESASDVYQSSSNTMVPTSNADFVAWGRTPTPIANEAELAGVLQGYNYLPLWLLTSKPSFIQPAPSTYSKGQLASYTAEARRTRMEGDIVVNGLPFSTDPLTYSSLNSAFIYTQAKTGDVFSWKLPDGSFITLNKADIEALHDASNSFGQACFTCEDNTLTAIEAGTTTTLAQIDAAFAAINASFTGLSAEGSLKRRHQRAK